MARPIVLSNGELHVGLDEHGLVHDFYFPYVGLENQIASREVYHRLGVWVDGQLSWLDDGNWQISQSYPTPVLVGNLVAKNQSLGLELEVSSFVDSELSAFVRTISLTNQCDEPRQIRLFLHQAFIIGDSHSNTDTAQFLPDTHAILHYRGRRAFVVSGRHNNQPFDQHSIGLFGIEGHEGTYRDADDGELSNSNVEHGRVDSTIRFSLNLTARAKDRLSYWIAAGTSAREALYVNKQLVTKGGLARQKVTEQFWQHWLQPAKKVAKRLPVSYQDSFLRSLLIIKSQIDKRGAVIASTDTTMLNFSRDAYAYCWPRDASLVLWPLIRLGYTDEPYRFFEFATRGLHPNGYLMHKYQADGALGSSWHPYVHDDGVIAPPIQVDETALTLFMFCQFFQQQRRDVSLLRDFYDSLVKPMATFLAGYIDETTGLPKPSYDLWEEIFESTTFTTATVYAALAAASEVASVKGDDASAVRWRSAADDIRLSAHKLLFNQDRQAFYTGLIVKKGTVVYDNTIDVSSVFGAFMFGLFSTQSPEMTASIATIKQIFTFQKDRPGLPRHEHDDYYRVSSNQAGNWWIITSLWLAQYAIETGNVELRDEILGWVKSVITPSGVLPEQVDPRDGKSPISVAPLTWSQAEYVSTLLDMITISGT